MNYQHVHEEEDYASPEVMVPLILSKLKVASVVDVGCGQGTWLKVFRKHGVRQLLGIESPETIANYLASEQFEVMGHDLTRPFFGDVKFDLAICLEVAEHLDPSAAETLVETLTGLSDQILFSAAIPNQGGQNHVNEQWPPYWRDIFSRYNYSMLDPFRAEVWENDKISWCYRQNMVLVRKGTLDEADIPAFKNNYIHPELYQLKVDSIDHIYRGRIGPRRAFRILARSMFWRLGLID